MRKTEHKKSEEKNLKKTQKFHKKKQEKNQAKNEAKIHSKTRGNSRTMEWLKIPEVKQKEFRKNHIATTVDYMQYTCYDISEPLINISRILGLSYDIDTDNSNTSFNEKKNLTLSHKETDKGQAYMITFHTPGFAPIPIISVEIYNEDKVRLLKTEGKIVFYGAFFVFNEILKEEAPETIVFHDSIEYNQIICPNTENKKLYKRTRVDIATDVKTSISKDWIKKYIIPHKNSNQAIRHYNYQSEQDMFQSLAYIPNITKGIGIRIYNKILDIMKKKKQGWYPNYGTEEIPTVTRIEIVFGGDTAQDSIDNLINFAKHKILGTEKIKIKRIARPKSDYSALSAFEYFKRYAKNHGKSLKDVLDDVLCLAIEEEFKDREKEYY